MEGLTSTPHAGMTKLFVYGTLLRGLSRAQMLRGSPFLGPALISGQLFDLGRYPGLRAGNSSAVKRRLKHIVRFRFTVTR